MSQSVRLNSRARENIHSITLSHKNISSINDLCLKTCTCQKKVVPLQPQKLQMLLCHPNRWCNIGYILKY